MLDPADGIIHPSSCCQKQLMLLPKTVDGIIHPSSELQETWSK
jgi:hypothetical protein